MKDKLIFDTTDVDTIADSDSVGAFVRASDGSLIDSAEINSINRLAVDSTLKDGAGNALTSTDGALDVNLASPLSIDVDLDHVEGDSVQIGDGVEIMSVNTDGSINVRISDGLDALDINTNGSINVEASDLDIRDLAFATDSVTAHQGGTWTIDSITNDVTVIATDLDIRDLNSATDSVTVLASDLDIRDLDSATDSVTVLATDLDIRDLAFATDSVTAHQGGTWTIDSITNDVTVTATDLDIRDLDAASDSVQAWAHDGIGLAITSTAVNSSQALDVNIVNEIDVEDVALANASIASAAKATVGDVVASPLADRKYLYIYNQGNQKMFIGANGVTTANGFPLSPGSYLELRAGDAVDIEFAQAGGNIDVRSLELA
jgi:hypothetical protein